jgi:hypothetical protein
MVAKRVLWCQQLLHDIGYQKYIGSNAIVMKKFLLMAR